MKLTYSTPEIRVTLFSFKDVMTTSPMMQRDNTYDDVETIDDNLDDFQQGEAW